jgi:hypothetical protein
VSSEFAQVLRLGRSIAVRMVLPAVVTLAAMAPSRPAVAQAIKGEISVTVENGFARRLTSRSIASPPIPVATWQRRVAIPTGRPFVLRSRAR